MKLRWRIFVIGLCVAAAPLGPKPASAQDCPTEKNGRSGYVVERSGSAKTEVFHDASIVRTIYRVSGNTLLETTQFQGIFDLERLDRGRRFTFKPKKELAAHFPLKAKQRVSAEFEIAEAGVPARKRIVELQVLGPEDLYIGKCKYSVLKIERSQGQGDQPPVFFNVDYYSPELKLIVAKEFRDSGGRTTMTKFDRIYPIGQ